MSVGSPERRPSVLGTTIVDWLRFVLVSVYLALVGLFLLARRKIVIGISPRQLASFVARAVRRPGHALGGALTGIRAEEGHCYLARAPWAAVSDSEARSRIGLWENDRPLGPAHCSHDAVRREGGGRFSHWEGWIYFSASDNSDPRVNGRTYRYSEENGETKSGTR